MMHMEASSRRRGVSLAMGEGVFLRNRNIQVPVMDYPSTSMTAGLPIKRDITLEIENNANYDNWEPNWIPVGNLDSVVQVAAQRNSQPYVSLLNDALAEVSRLEEQRSAKVVEKQRKEAMELAKAASIEKKVEPNPSTGLKPIPVLQSTVQSIAEQPCSDGERTQQKDSHEEYLPCNNYTRKIDDYEAEYEQIKLEYDSFVQEGNPMVKQIRIDIAKKVITTINTLAGTQKQVDHSYSTLLSIQKTYSAEPKVVVFLTFMVIEKVLDCCNPGCQLYLNPKSAWPFAHLIRGVMIMHPSCRAIYYSMIKKRCPYVVPRLYRSDSQETLERLHAYSSRESKTYFKKQVALVRLHMALMAITDDSPGLWMWFAGFLNACSKNVFKHPLAGILLTALTTASHLCLAKYRSQFKKVLVCCEDMLKSSMFKVRNCEASDMYNDQLSQFFRDYRKTGTIMEPEGFNLKKQEEKLHQDV